MGDNIGRSKPEPLRKRAIGSGRGAVLLRLLCRLERFEFGFVGHQITTPRLGRVTPHSGKRAGRAMFLVAMVGHEARVLGSLNAQKNE